MEKGDGAMHWWMRNNLRLWQNNIMETDGNLDVDRLIEGVWTLDDCADASRLLAYAVPGKRPT